MTYQSPIRIGQGVDLQPRSLTRHVGIFGATGTGKTETAKAIVQQLACPVIVLDAKGDLGPQGTVVAPWTGAQMTVSGLGSDLMQRVLDLSPAQSGALEIALAWADDHGRRCHTLDDLRLILSKIVERQIDVSGYGLVSRQSVEAVMRAILRFSRAAPWAFGPSRFGPLDTEGVTVIHAPDLVAVHGLYAAFASHLLRSIYDGLGEIGDSHAPGLAVMIDEAHLLFQDAPQAVVRRLEQIVRLIRSKGVALIFVTQAPADLPPAILGQIGTRIQHGLRGATQQQLQAVKAAADTMPGAVTGADILGLGIGEAYVTTGDAQGIPQPAVRVRIARSRPGSGVIFYDAPPAGAGTRQQHVDISQTPPADAATVAVEQVRRPWYLWPMLGLTVLALLMIVNG